jgi:hypothetical protein
VPEVFGSEKNPRTDLRLASFRSARVAAARTLYCDTGTSSASLSMPLSEVGAGPISVIALPLP